MVKKLGFSLKVGALTALLAFHHVARAQSDRDVTTTREKNAPSVPASVYDKMNVADYPRYFLDSIDSLNRLTSDLTRPAPGLVKNNYIAKVYPVYNTEAIQIQSYLLRSLAFEGGTVEVMGASEVTDEEGADVQFLFVTAPDFMIPGITEIVEMADRPGFKFFDATGLDFGGGPGAVRYIGKHRTASELVAILAGTELGNVGAFLFPPFADDSTNSIYIVENPTDIADDLLALEMFDVPPLQVELEVMIYEIARTDMRKLGLDWDSWKRFIAGNFTYADISGDFFFDDSMNVYSTLLDLNAAALTEFLNYTVSTGTSDLVLATRVTMVNSEDNPGGLAGGARGTATADPAIVSTMSTIPYVRTLGTNEVRQEVVSGPTEEGILLEVLPFIGTESITLDVQVVVNSLVGFSPEENVPLISSRTTSSIVNLQNGEYLVLGGLSKQSTVETRTGIPLLKEIPVVKYLFSKEVQRRETSEILISLHPVLRSSSEVDPALAMIGP